jgi:hypothetical protein
MTRIQGGQKTRRTLLGQKLNPPRVGKRPVRLILGGRKQQAASEHRRKGVR